MSIFRMRRALKEAEVLASDSATLPMLLIPVSRVQVLKLSPFVASCEETQIACQQVILACQLSTPFSCSPLLIDSHLLLPARNGCSNWPQAAGSKSLPLT